MLTSPGFVFYMATLHIFNPETDYALAVGRNQYTPPAKVARMRDNLAALPAIFAQPGDYIFMPNGGLRDTDYVSLALQRNIQCVEERQLASLAIDRVSPWGWNHTVRRMLIRRGVAERLLPAESDIDALRALAHRRTTIQMHRLMQLPSGCVAMHPQEFADVASLSRWLKTQSDAYLKAPWSSSGRGVVRVSSLSQSALMKWCGGIIASQGSVMAEPAIERRGDFATEWICAAGKAIFQSFSMFETDSNGHYAGNLSVDDCVLKQRIADMCSTNLQLVVGEQRRVLDMIISPYYEGPLGIDMLVDVSGRVDACVEINLRHTMGMVASRLYKLTGRERVFTPLSFHL